jgi:hypothetical protein
MHKNPLSVCLLCSVVLMGISLSVAQQAMPSRVPVISKNARIANRIGNLPLTFEPNQGQTGSQAQFITRGKGYSAFMTTSGIVLSLRAAGNSRTIGGSAEIGGLKQKATLSLNFVGAAQNPTILGEDRLAGHLNYFMGNDPQQWRTNIPLYSKVRYKNVYPGIDLVYYGNRQQLEYDFEVSPHANPNLIQFEIKGASSVRLDKDGSLILKVQGNELRLQNPTVYQQINGRRLAADGEYVLSDPTHVTFRVSHYDANEAVVIDPVLAYCTYLGGSADEEAEAITIDSTGAIYITGTTDSPNFPGTTSASLGAFNGQDVFVAKLDPTGSTLVYADYLGGRNLNIGTAVTLDNSNDVYVTGYTTSADFPMVSPFQASLAGDSDAFVSEISSDGSKLLYSTFLGGSTYDNPVGVALDGSGNLIVAGWTTSKDFPVYNAYQATVSPNQGGQYGSYGFVAKFAPGFQSFVYSTYLGGSAQVMQSSPNGPYWSDPASNITGLALDTSGNAYVTGVTDTSDFPTTVGAFLSTYSSPVNMPVSFVSKFGGSGTLSYSTLLYGSDGSETDTAAITVDSTGSAYVTGATMSGAAFPITAKSICDPSVSGSACNYGFITKFNPNGSGLVYSTFLGPNNLFSPNAIALDTNDNVYVMGENYTGSFATVNGIEQYPAGVGSALLLVEIDSTASTQLFATYLGGSIDGASPAGLAVDASGNIYGAGVSSDTDVPTTLGTYQKTEAGGADAFLFKIQPPAAPAVSPSPGSLQYSLQTVGQTSSPQSVLLRNMGSAPLLISSVAITGDFSQSNDCSTMVAAASACTLTVSFSPTAPGTRSGTVVIQDNAPGSPHVIQLQADSSGSELSLNFSSLSFGDVPIGSSSAAQGVTLTNTGTLDLDISNVQVSDSYSQTSNCPTILSRGSSCQFQIVFTASATGTSFGNFSVSGNAFNSPQSTALNGTGVDFALTTSEPSKTVSPGESGTYNLKLLPVGGSFPNPIELRCSGLPSGGTCNFSSNALNLGNKTTEITLTISSGAKSVAGRPTTSENPFAYSAALGLQSAGVLGLLLAIPNRRSGKMRARMLPLLIALTLFAASCAGGTGMVRQNQTGTTQPTTYNVTVTATSGRLQHSLQLKLSVEN